MARPSSWIRAIVLALAGAGSFAAAWRLSSGPELVDAVEPVRTARVAAAVQATGGPASVPSQASAAQVAQVAPVDPAASDVDLFATRNWTPPPAQAPAAAPLPPVGPQPPTVPALAVSYVGMIGGRDEAPRVFLVLHDQLFVAAQGDTIDESYRVESITPDRVELTYLPAGIRQGIEISGGME